MKLRIVAPRNGFRRVASLLLLIAGIACLSIYSYSYVYRTAYQYYEGWRFDHEPPAPPPKPAPQPAALPAVLPNPDRAAPRRQAPSSPGIIGRLTIPRLHLSAIVEEGVDDLTLERAVGHIPGTALPGHDGNVGIAGHRDTFFRALRDLQPRDKIDFTTRWGHFHYVVKSMTIVQPDDVGVLRSTGAETLTIVTCFPFNYIGAAPHRFIVHAVADE